MAIHFGTSGWRAIIADEFTFVNVRKVARAIVRYLYQHKLEKNGIIIGYDTRFLSREFAQECAQEFSQHAVKALLTNRDCPTPVIAYQILKQKTAGAVNITASHNPPEYSGIKFSPAYGGPAPLEVTQEIEKNLQDLVLPEPAKKTAVQVFDPRPAYLKKMGQLVDLQAIRRARLKLGVDVLYGTGRGYLDQLLKQAGCRISLLHDRVEPLFGGLPPEPAEAQLKQLRAVVKKERLHLGLALDGDADRFGIVDRDGSYIGANQVISLLTEHLIRTRPRQKKVARTLATTHMIDALAQRAGLKVVETPVGFKFIGQELARGGCLIGGEESGGLSIAGHVPEKDGILACLLIAELVAIRKKSLGAILKELYKEVGPYFNQREDFHLSAREKERFLQRIKLLTQGKPALLGRTVAQFNGLDGYKFIFTDGSWLMFRSSGTEPIVRCYAEASSKQRLKNLLEAGKKLVNS